MTDTINYSKGSPFRRHLRELQKRQYSTNNLERRETQVEHDSSLNEVERNKLLAVIEGLIEKHQREFVEWALSE